MILSTVDSRPIQYGLRLGGKWFNFLTSTPAVQVWETPLVAANHLKSMTADAGFPAIQESAIPNYAVVASDSIVVFTGGVPISTIDCPPNLYVGPWPGQFTIK